MYREAKYFLLFPLVSIAILTFIASASASCITPEEREANKIRSLQTQMMVGALQCRGRRDLGQRSYYNQFVITHKTELSEAGKTLLGYFKRVHGDKFNFVMDKHVTNLANEISLSTRNFAPASPHWGPGLLTVPTFLQPLLKLR